MTRKVTTVKLKMEDHEKIELFCANNKIPKSELIRRALKEYLARYGVEIEGD